MLILFFIKHEASFPTPRESGYCFNFLETFKLVIFFIKAELCPTNKISFEVTLLTKK